MDLNNEQKAQVASWVDEGIGLSEIQAKLKEAFGISLTFMEVRFLIDDLDLSLADKITGKGEQNKAEQGLVGEGAVPSEATSMAEPDAEPADAGGEWQQPNALAGGGKVSVDVDKIQRPGAVMSGNVTFSDGERMGWQLDQSGRLGLIPGKEGYRPSESDLADFQAALQAELQKQGF